MWILFAAHAFSTAYTTLGASDLMNHLMSLIPGGQWGALAFMLFVLLLLGMVLDPVGIMLITLPVFLPVVKSYGWDSIWFGVIFIIMMEIGYMTPPFGFNLFYLKAVAPPEVTMGDIYWSVIPYVLVTFVGVFILIIFPEIALYFPNLFFGVQR
jgi:TRAP-type mannitol/chloroaromatic compound transport system permease large subunit